MAKQNISEKKRTTVYIDKTIYTRLKFLAAIRDVRLNDCVVEALLKYLEENKSLLPKIK